MASTGQKIPIAFNSQPQAYWIIAIYEGLYACG